MKFKDITDGAWEERGVIGTRIEIEKGVLTVLWRNAPVLKTKFSPVEKDGGLELELKQNGLRYENDVKDYANVTRIFIKDGKMEFEEFFPISGASKNTLEKTASSRFGNYTICDDILKELQGTWRDERGWHELVFRKDTLTVFGRTIKIHALHSNYESAPKGEYLIVDADPSNYELYAMSRLTYYDGVLRGHELICDAPPATLLFKKVQ